MRMAAHCGCPETDSFSDRAITNLDVACPETDSFSDRAITNLDVAEESENEA